MVIGISSTAKGHKGNHKGSQSIFIEALYLFLKISGKQSFKLFDSDRFRNKIFYS